MTYATDRASYLDIRQSVANAIDAFDDPDEPTDQYVSSERADAALAATRRGMADAIVKRLADPGYRGELAGALVALVLP
jgi:hypothetical protein